MLTRQGRLCWCVVFPAAPGRCEWCGQGREILKAGQAQSLWGRLGQVFKESLFSSRLRALGYTLLFCSQFSNYCELTNSLPIFFSPPTCGWSLSAACLLGSLPQHSEYWRWWQGLWGDTAATQVGTCHSRGHSGDWVCPASCHLPWGHLSGKCPQRPYREACPRPPSPDQEAEAQTWPGPTAVCERGPLLWADTCPPQGWWSWRETSR